MKPSELGAPEKYTRWRPGQDRAFDHLIASDKRFDALALPTGTGKSLIAMLYPKLLNQRAVILTSTKGLQDQYASLFPEDTVDLRGMNNYDCMHEDARAVDTRGKVKQLRCDEGPCLDGVECELYDFADRPRKPGCLYFDAFARAREAQIVVTNYSLWFSLLHSTRSLGDRSVVVCDEAHDAFAQICSAVGCALNEEELELPRGTASWSIVKEWREWAQQKGYETRIALEGTQSPRLRRQLRNLGRKLANLENATGDWVMAETEERGLRGLNFEPLWPGPYAERTLWRGAEKVILLSATITPKLLDFLNIAKSERYWFDCPSPFPAVRRPIIHIPTVKVTRTSTDSEMRVWVSRIDQIIRARGDRKGIVHTVSYARAKMLKDQSEFRDIMLVPRNGAETKQAVEAFRDSAPPRVLVSPSVHTGYDFPYDLARYQVIGKMPFPDNRDPICAARAKADSEYLLWAAIVQMVQASGRVVRAEDDLGECVAPGTRVLTADLRWKPAEEFEVGQEVLTHTEQSGGRGIGRVFQSAEVERCLVRTMPRVRVVHSEGEMVCTPNHPWLVLKSNSHEWRRADRLRPGQTLLRVLEPWSDPASYEEGWLSGFADGEGSFAREGKGKLSHLVLSQNEGAALARAESALRKLGFRFSKTRAAQTCHTVPHFRLDIRGGYAETLRFLGQLRPVRLLGRYREKTIGSKIHNHQGGAVVLAVERLSPGPIVSLQTSAKTYLAEGFSAHNTFIVDDMVNQPWIIRKHREHFPKWWLEAYKSQGIIPKPMGLV